MTLAQMTVPLMLELDKETRQAQLDSVEAWLGNVMMSQRSFRTLAEATHDKLHEPHLREYLQQIIETAIRHEQQVELLYQIIDRDPASGRKFAGTFMAKAREVMADMEGAAGGAVGGWRDLRQLFLSSLNAMGAFAVAEQLGFALGIKEIVDITFVVTNEKHTQHLLLQEIILETAAISILYKMDP